MCCSDRLSLSLPLVHISQAGKVDCVLIGPHDLSCNLGVPEKYDHPTFQAAVKTIFSKARGAGVGADIHQIGPLFGSGMQNSDAVTMVRLHHVLV